MVSTVNTEISSHPTTTLCTGSHGGPCRASDSSRPRFLPDRSGGPEQLVQHRSRTPPRKKATSHHLPFRLRPSGRALPGSTQQRREGREAGQGCPGRAAPEGRRLPPKRAPDEALPAFLEGSQAGPEGGREAGSPRDLAPCPAARCASRTACPPANKVSSPARRTPHHRSPCSLAPRRPASRGGRAGTPPRPLGRQGRMVSTHLGG